MKVQAFLDGKEGAAGKLQFIIGCSLLSTDAMRRSNRSY